MERILAARLIIEEALEGKARDALGRECYARGAVPGAGTAMAIERVECAVQRGLSSTGAADRRSCRAFSLAPSGGGAGPRAPRP
jgi:hypothetical protein